MKKHLDTRLIRWVDGRRFGQVLFPSFCFPTQQVAMKGLASLYFTGPGDLEPLLGTGV